MPDKSLFPLTSRYLVQPRFTTQMPGHSLQTSLDNSSTHYASAGLRPREVRMDHGTVAKFQVETHVSFESTPMKEMVD